MLFVQADSAEPGVLNLLGLNNPIANIQANHLVWGDVANWTDNYHPVWGDNIDCRRASTRSGATRAHGLEPSRLGRRGRRRRTLTGRERETGQACPRAARIYLDGLGRRISLGVLRPRARPRRRAGAVPDLAALTLLSAASRSRFRRLKRTLAI